MYKQLNNVYLTTEAEAASVYAISELVRVRENPLIEVIMALDDRVLN